MYKLVYNFQKKKYKKKIYKRRSERKKVFFFAPPTCAHDARDARVTRVRVHTYVCVYVHNVYDRV